MLRGVCGVYESCRRLGYKYILDIANHTISNFFEISDHYYSETIKANKDNIRIELFGSYRELDNFITSHLKDKEYIYFMTHCSLFVYQTPLSEDCRNFIKKTLTPKKEFQEFLDAHMPSSPYNVIHYRLGDEALLRGNKSNIDTVYANLQHHGKTGDILLSDSAYFKEYVKINLPDRFTILDTQQCHVGRATDMNALRDTLFEFIVAMRANSIKTYSIYCWISGFINTISHIYGVSVVSIK